MADQDDLTRVSDGLCDVAYMVLDRSIPLLWRFDSARKLEDGAAALEETLSVLGYIVADLEWLEKEWSENAENHDENA